MALDEQKRAELAEMVSDLVDMRRRLEEMHKEAKADLDPREDGHLFEAPEWITRAIQYLRESASIPTPVRHCHFCNHPHLDDEDVEDCAECGRRIDWERDNESTWFALELVSETADITEAAIAGWTDEECFDAEAYAAALHARASDNDDVEVPERPAFLDDAERTPPRTWRYMLAQARKARERERDFARRVREIAEDRAEFRATRCVHVWPLPAGQPQNCERCGDGRDGAPDIPRESTP